jgi:choline dehydrogenase-like flavoprotein
MAVSTADGGVVDPDLKIFGTDNSYVCSSSVFPCSGFVNPTHTIMALAYRLADHLEQRLAAGQFSAGATPSVTASARARA